MKKNGFTLIEFLGCLALLGVVLIMGLCASRDVMKTSLATFRNVSDDEVFSAAKNYAFDNDFNNHGYICVSVSDLIKNDYLKDTSDIKLRNKFVVVYGDNATKMITIVKYVERCD